MARAGGRDSSGGGGQAAAVQVARRLAAASVDAVALAMVDNAGVTLVKTIPLRRFEDAVRFGIGLSPVFTVFLVDDQITSSPDIGGPTGDTRLMPDPGGTVALAASPGWALAPVDQLDQEGEPYPGCTRTFARNMLERLRGHGLKLRGSYELEFFLGRRERGETDAEPDPEPAHGGPAYGANALIDVEPFATALIRALEAQGTGVMQFHPEYSTGQLELSVPHGTGIAVADTNLVVRHTIRAVARDQGFAASFSPVVFAGLVGNGHHLHLSLWDKGRNLFNGGRGPDGMTRRAESFTAGVLEALPALTAIMAPSVTSYQRLQPHRWSGPWACWGRENREAALRFVTGMVGSRADAANLEVKAMDAAANPYLALGAIVAAGIDGLERELSLPEPVLDDPASIPAARRRSMGIRRLPSSLGAAIRELERSSMLHDAMGDVLFDAFLATRRGERAAFEGKDPAEVVRAHRWRY
jgi:glutamine synthetase